MIQQLQLFPPRPSADVEKAIAEILERRRRYGVSGQAGEDIALIRAALMKESVA